jgi:hypothetical protein
MSARRCAFSRLDEPHAPRNLEIRNAQKFTPLVFFLSQAINFAYAKTTLKEFFQFMLKRCAG